MNSIYVTGIGLLSCCGIGAEAFWNTLTGESNEEKLQMPLTIPAIFSAKVTRRMDRFSNLALVASKMALESSPFDENNMNPYRIGTIFSTLYGSINSNLSFGKKLVEAGVDMVSPTMFSNTVYNACIGHTCINLGVKGVSTMLIGGNSIGYSYDLLRAEQADGILCGGIEEYCQDIQDCFFKQENMTKDDDVLCKPLSQISDGTKITEGSTILMLEAIDEDESIPPKAVCKIMGYGNAFSSECSGCAMQSMDVSAFISAMELALSNSSIKPEQIDGIFMAANGVRYSDVAEMEAIKTVFKNNASTVSVTAIKEKTGEMLGASFSSNVAAAAISLQKGKMPIMSNVAKNELITEFNIATENNNAGKYTYFMVNGYDFTGSVYSIILRRI